ncbi:two-component regulator propeller domain-containing protein [Bernardetia sp.]|uniref:two-component regulator propeller domain-containing protein n=1 Tax=Bernardetia sp. TaxID=1937974 RepID=UPI0025BFDBB5|nr:two-component regulator propeller domain-containing protein [Bernardetia sp.]
MRFLFVVVFLLVCSSVAFAQESTASPVRPSVLFTQYSTDNGLSNNSVKCILQDSNGFMWFGTRDGLSRFDAYSFQSYKSAPTLEGGISKGLSDTYILAMAQSINPNKETEKIWLGTNNGGLNYFDYQSKVFHHYPVAINRKIQRKDNTLSDVTVQALAVEQDKGQEFVWIGTKRGGLQVLDVEKGEFDTFLNDEKDSTSLYSNEVSAIKIDPQNKVWVATTILQLFDREKKSFKNFYFSNDDGKASISKLFLDKKNRLWILTWDEGIYIFDTEKEQFVKKIYTPPITAAAQDTEGNIWCSTFGAGVFKYDKEGNFITKYGVEDFEFGLKEALAWDIYADAMGGIWLGLYSEGIEYFSPQNQQFRLWKGNTEVFKGSEVWDIEYENDSVLWFATEKGLEKIKFENEYQKITSIDYLVGKKIPPVLDGLITTLLRAKDNTLWVGTWQGLAKLETNTKTQKSNVTVFETDRNRPEALKGNKITALGEDKEGNIWVGMLYGLAKYDKETQDFEHFFPQSNDSTSLNDGYVTAVLQDSKNRLWVGTRNGLHLYDKEKNNFKRILNEVEKSNSISHNQINAIFEDKNNTLWIGTNGGLNWLNNEDNNSFSFEHLTEKNGLPSDVIQAIEEDTNGNLWLTTNKGLSFFNKTQKNKRQSQFTNYNKLDGLQSNDFKRGALTRLPNGVIFMGGKEGFNAFHPNYLKRNSIAPKMAFTGFKLFGKSVVVRDSLHKDSPLEKSINQVKEIILSHQDRVIEFDFTALNYFLPQKTHFAYKMEEYDENWHYTDADRKFATYTSLPAGKYTFKIKATNADGVWSEEKSIFIKVTPPFYKTWWFLIVAPLIVLTVGYLLYKNRIAQIEKRNLKLEQTVKERTAEIKVKNEELVSINDDLHGKNQEILVKNEELEQQQEEILAQRDEIEKQNNSLKQLNDNLETSYQNLNILTTIGQEITSVLELKEVIRQIYERIQSIMPVEGFGIGLYRKEKNELYYTGYIEKGKILPDHSEKIDVEGIGNWALKKQEVVFINDLEKEYGKYISELGELIEGEEPQSILYVPLSILDKGEIRKIGVLTVQSFEKNAYTNRHVTILKSLATYISIALKNAETYTQLDIANAQTHSINEKLTDSIRYAQTIQQSVLSVHNTMYHNFSECEVIYRPASGVSGDFYWFSKIELTKKQLENTTFFNESLKDKVTARILAVSDCTGHGVPGAFMSLIGNGLLNEIVNQRQIIEPKFILKELHEGIRTLLRQDKLDENVMVNQDGMDISVCLVIENKDGTFKIVYSGAKRPMYYTQKGMLKIIRGTRKSVGGRQKENVRTFEQEIIEIEKNELIYLFTDGIADQNNSTMERIGSQNVFGFIDKVKHQDLATQKQNIESFIDSHQGNETQRDDITFLMARV